MLGSIPPEELAKMLPTMNKAHTDVTSLNVPVIKKSIKRSLYRGMQQPLGITQITWPLCIGGSIPEAERTHLKRLEESQLTDFACQVLELRLRERLRFDLGAIYNVGVYVSTSNAAPLHPNNPVTTLDGMLVVSFSCAPSMIAKLEAVVHAEVENLRSNAADNGNPLKASEIRSVVATSRTSRVEG